MEGKKLHSMNIDGMGQYPGGEFDSVNISGVGKVEGNLICNELNASGTIKINGKLTAKNSKVSGTAKVNGDIFGEALNVSGMLKATGGGSVKNVLINGMLKFEKALKVKDLENNGSMAVEGDLSGEEIKSYGMITCNGLLNCESLILKLSGVSCINEIGATTVKVEDSQSGFNGFFSFLVPKKFRNNQLVVTSIEGDEIYLENCEAKVVRGKTITIGPYCNIETVEYTEALNVHEKSSVGNRIRQ